MDDIIRATKKKVKYTSDWTLWACYIILCAVSIVEVFSASSLELKNGNVYLPITSHVQWLGLGFILVFGLEHLHYKYTKIMMLFVVSYTPDVTTNGISLFTIAFVIFSCNSVRYANV